MSVAQLKLADTSGAGMDTPVEQRFWQKWPLAARVGGAVAGITIFIFAALALIIGDSVRTLRVPAAQHSEMDTDAYVPAEGLQRATRAYAKIIDEVNKLDLQDLTSPEPIP